METPTIEELEAMPPDELAALPWEAIIAMSQAQAQSLPSEQVETVIWVRYDRALSLEQRQAIMRGVEEAGIEVPIVLRLYSRMLEQIENKERLLDQSVFGPTHDPGANLHIAPMSIRGHTVHLAGEEGYLLSYRIGFGLAALLIHTKSRPDVEPPDFEISNHIALAYIRARAAEETQ